MNSKDGNRISKAFARGKAFIAFLTGGDPSLEASEAFILEMIRAGADLIEIGVPFSDPIAEGEVIQRANLRALSSGTILEGLFGLVERVRGKSDVPLVFLSYLNPLFRYGYEAFFERCRAAGADGVIVPDLPFEEQAELLEPARASGVDVVSLVAPTSEARILEIAKNASGFLYIVSSMGVTGVRGAFESDVAAMVRLAKSASSIPAAVGFGVGTPDRARETARVADGVIVGSAIVRIIEERGAEAGPELYRFVKEMKSAATG
ncbi:MAG: tryptophan synthase subunit alpha [Clostridiales Family XIII bacterium]|jgi:tryptophan synthase alpha chain|nr:tryptophan synthase subunit alpha [Clostridiales Family XIII bacterium]